MKLTSREVGKLSAIEKKALKKFIWPVSRKSRQALFEAQSKVYVEGDENILPYPERSAKGFRLEDMGNRLVNSSVALVLKPQSADMTEFIALKLRKKLPKTFISSSPKNEILAAIYKGTSPFDYWRDNLPLDLPSVSEEAIVVLDPPQTVLDHGGDEFAVGGAYIKSEDIEDTISMLESPENEDNVVAQWIRLLAGEGLTHVTPLEHGIWLAASQRKQSPA